MNLFVWHTSIQVEDSLHKWIKAVNPIIKTGPLRVCCEKFSVNISADEIFYAEKNPWCISKQAMHDIYPLSSQTKQHRNLHFDQKKHSGSVGIPSIHSASSLPLLWPRPAANGNVSEAHCSFQALLQFDVVGCYVRQEAAANKAREVWPRPDFNSWTLTLICVCRIWCCQTPLEKKNNPSLSGANTSPFSWRPSMQTVGPTIAVSYSIHSQHWLQSFRSVFLIFTNTHRIKKIYIYISYPLTTEYICY